MTSLEELVLKLKSYFIEDSTIEAAYLFGSFAHGRQRAGSDVDIAILLDERRGRIERKALMDRLLQDLGRLLRRDIHILILNDASCTARIEAVFRGRCIDVKDQEALAQFKMLTLAHFADFGPVMDRFHDKLKQRLGVKGHGQ
jgi:predicted nucleotidyltransferase